MIAWLLYVLLVSLLLGLAALSFEASALLRRKGTRWLWGMSIIASLAMPFVISSITVQLPNLTRAAPQAQGKALALRQMTESALSPAKWVSGSVALPASLGNILATLWAVSSALLLIGLMVSGFRLQRRRRGWLANRVAGQPVLLAEDVGPAVVGLFDPVIVVPHWLLDSPTSEQELVIAHEQSHLEANDAALLQIALALVICMPWNPPLWWQLRRLRRAIEVDCDARVLRRGHDVVRYGETLLTVGERHSRRIAVVAAMTESKSFLEQRITTMLRKKAKFAWASALVLLLVGMVLTAGAAEVTPPNADKPAHKEISLDARSLGGYVGVYKFTGTALMTVTLDGKQLSAQLTGQPPFPIFPESTTDFFYKAVNAQITFIPDGQGGTGSLVLHQNGANSTMPRIDEAAARQISAEAAARFASQTPDPASEAAMRRLMEGIIAGAVPYDRMSDQLAAIFKQHGAQLAVFAGQGAIKSVRFIGVSPNGSEAFSILQETGASHWQISLDSEGRIVSAVGLLGP